MRLADSEIEINLGHEVVYLKPTLRAAFRLVRKYGSYKALFEAVIDCSLSAISDCIREGATKPTTLNGYLDDISQPGLPLHVGITQLIWPVITFLDELANVEIGGPATAGEQITFEEFHTRLFSIATGWLGWSPEQAFAASPAEIIEAQKGRVEMLRAVFGGGKSDDADTNTIERGENGRLDPDAIATLNAIGNHG